MGYSNILTAQEVAKKLGVTNYTVYRLIDEGRLKATNICNGNKYRRFQIREDDLNDLVYYKNKKRNEEPKKISPIRQNKIRPMAVLKKTPERKNEAAKKELAKLKEDLMDILIRIEEIENRL